MPARMIVGFADGKILLFGGASEPGMPDAGLSDGFSRATSETLTAALGSIGELVRSFEAAVEAMPKRPQGIEIEFGAALSHECDLWIVSMDASPEFEIKLAWG